MVTWVLMLICCIHFINQSIDNQSNVQHCPRQPGYCMNSCYLSFPFHTTVYDNLKCELRIYFSVNFASGSLLFQRSKGGVILSGII